MDSHIVKPTVDMFQIFNIILIWLSGGGGGTFLYRTPTFNQKVISICATGYNYLTCFLECNTVAVAGPGEGPRTSLIIRPNWGPKSQKNFCFETGPPPYLRVWMTPPPPTLIWRSGAATKLTLNDSNLALTWIKVDFPWVSFIHLQ